LDSIGVAFSALRGGATNPNVIAAFAEICVTPESLDSAVEEEVTVELVEVEVVVREGEDEGEEVRGE